MLIAVAGSSGLGDISGVASTHPTALLEVLPPQTPSHILYLAPSHLDVPARAQAHVVIAAHPQTRVYVFSAQHHALTLTLLGAVVAERKGIAGGWTDPGEAVQLLQESSAHSRSLVWHQRVLGLDEPQPTTRQRLASVFRGPGFFAEMGVPHSLSGGAVGIAARPDETLCIPGPVPGLLQAQLGSQHCSVVDVRPTMDRPYAVRTSVEICGLVRPTRVPLVSRPCPACGVSLMAAGCMFCGSGPQLGSNEHRQSTHRGPSIVHEVLGGQAA